MYHQSQTQTGTAVYDPDTGLISITPDNGASPMILDRSDLLPNFALILSLDGWSQVHSDDPRTPPAGWVPDAQGRFSVRVQRFRHNETWQRELDAVITRYGTTHFLNRVTLDCRAGGGPGETYVTYRLFPHDHTTWDDPEKGVVTVPMQDPDLRLYHRACAAHAIASANNLSLTLSDAIRGTVDTSRVQVATLLTRVKDHLAERGRQDGQAAAQRHPIRSRTNLHTLLDDDDPDQAAHTASMPFPSQNGDDLDHDRARAVLAETCAALAVRTDDLPPFHRVHAVNSGYLESYVIAWWETMRGREKDQFPDDN